MRVALLPVYCSGTQRRSPLTLAWYQTLASEIERYFGAQSGARLKLYCTAYEWRQIPLTSQAWIDAGPLAGRRVVEWMVGRGDLRREDFDVFVVLIDDATSSSGLAPAEAPETIIVAAVGVADDPFAATLVLHELGHRVGAQHTWLLTDDDKQSEYDSPFCIMGREHSKYSYVEPTLFQAAEGADATAALFGPGLCALNLLRCGWLHRLRHVVRVAPDDHGRLDHTVEVQALNGAPAEPVARAQVACFILASTDPRTDGEAHVVEYRSASTPYDKGVPSSGGIPLKKGKRAPLVPLGGQVVVYRTASMADPMALQVGVVAAEVGKSVVVTTPLNVALSQTLGGNALAKLTVTVLRVGSNAVQLRLVRQLG